MLIIEIHEIRMTKNGNPRNPPLNYEIHKDCQKYQLSKSTKSLDSHENPMQAYANVKST